MEDGLIDERELAGVVAEEIQRPDYASLPAQRHDELGVGARDGFDVTRIGVHVVHEQRQSVGDGGADEAFTDFHAKRARDFRGVADRVRDGQLAALRIEEVNSKRLELGDPGDELGNFLQELFEIEHGRDFAAQRKERRQCLGGIDR